MGRSKAFLGLLLLLVAVRAFADGTVFPPDPVGEQIYRSHRLLLDNMPLAFMAGAFLVLWVIRKIQLQIQTRRHHAG